MPYTRTDSHLKYYNTATTPIITHSKPYKSPNTKLRRLCEIIQSTCLIDGWADHWIPAEAIRGKLKIMNKILREASVKNSLHDGGFMTRIKLYKRQPWPAVFADTTVTYSKVCGHVKPPITSRPPPIYFLLHLLCPWQQWHIQMPSKHFPITLNSVQYFYYFWRWRARYLITMCLVKWDLRKNINLWNVSKFIDATTNDLNIMTTHCPGFIKHSVQSMYPVLFSKVILQLEQKSVLFKNDNMS
jgi:hypothetical protein